MSNYSKLAREALLLGHLDRSGRRKLARDSGASSPAAGDAIFSTPGQDPHLLTFAPNRSGRDRSCLIPNLRGYFGQTVVLDLDGKAYAATAQARRAVGHQVALLDPFGVTGMESDTFSPMEWLIGSDRSAFESGCQELAGLLSSGGSTGDAEENDAAALLGALIGYLYAVPEKQLGELYDTLRSDDVVYSLAVVLDAIGKKISPMVYSTIANFLEKEDGPRSRVLASAASMIKSWGSSEVQQSLKNSTFAFPSPQPVTVYLVFPVDRLAIHSALLRMWIGFFLLSAARTQEKQSVPILFLLDQCAALGTFPLLESMLTAPPAGPLRIWTFWHDVHQLRTTYPRSWPAIVSGSGAVQFFGTGDPAAAAEAGALLGLSAQELTSLGQEDEIVRLGGVSQRMRRPGAVVGSAKPAPVFKG